mgnify:CR=1 FL=1
MALAHVHYPQRSWRNWQTRYVEVVVPKGVEVRVLLTAPTQNLPTQTICHKSRMKATRRQFLKSASVIAFSGPMILNSQDKAEIKLSPGLNLIGAG